MVSNVGSLHSSVAQTSQSNALTTTTKALLESLGVDTSAITTEAQGKAALLVAQQEKAESSNSGKVSQGIQGSQNTVEQQIKQDAKSLAVQVGIFVGSQDELPDIIGKISDAISSQQVKAGQDPLKLANIQQYQNKLDAINKQIADVENTGNQKLQNSMSALASYNMASISLSQK